MEAVTELQRDLVLVGGGHSHVLALRMLVMKPIEGLRITLISPSSHTPYSGMLPGLIAGHYSFEQTHIDLARLCQWAGVRFIQGEVSALDTAKKRLSVRGRPDIEYDIASIDIGSQPELDSVPGARANATPVKPIASFWQRWQSLQARIDEGDLPDAYRVAVVGGGAGSVELALAIAHRLRGSPAVLELWCAAADILQGYNNRSRRAVMSELARQGIRVHLDSRVVTVEPGQLVLASGDRAPYDELFWCTAAAAAPWIAASGLATDEHGFLLVRDTLQARDEDSVFGAGDIATQIEHPRPKAGVYAVRQAPVLADNLRASLLGKPLRQHRPQRRFLSLLSLGERRATADKGSFSASGAWVWHWKDRIDRKFMSRFKDLPVPMPHGPGDSLPELLQESPPQPACGGCGAKVGADALGSALARLHREYPQYCSPEPDDAAPVPVAAGHTVIQSIDILRQLVADPWVMGRIAANHALSDLHACGASPVSALAAVTLPYANPALLERELYQLLAGALHEFAAVGCELSGGHSMQGNELGLGFVVNGVSPAEGGGLLRKTGALPGDQLVLTKPLGTGVLFAGHMQLLADGRDVSAAVASMLQGNGPAAQLARAHNAHACTDITGFGLLGHLLEMLSGERGAQLALARLPLLPGALDLLRAGVASTMEEPNRRSAGNALQTTGNVDLARLRSLFDPQTSGGLLIAVPADSASTLVNELHQAGYGESQVIGEVMPMPDDTGQVQVHW